jgi:hypothetical protein
LATDDIKQLVNLLSGCAICLNSGSTLSIDAVIHDKPVIVTLFDADQDLLWWQSARRIREFPHYRKLLAMGGVQPVATYAELEQEIDNYLRHPQRHAEGRSLTVTRQCGSIDGQASNRVAHSLLQIVNRTRTGQVLAREVGREHSPRDEMG